MYILHLERLQHWFRKGHSGPDGAVLITTLLSKHCSLGFRGAENVTNEDIQMKMTKTGIRLIIEL